MSYQSLLRESAKNTKNVACMGLDPIIESLPETTGNIRNDLNTFFQQLFRRMRLSGLIPSAFKPNLGYYQCLDRPRDEDFSGSSALSDLLDMLENFFPGVPVILDSKRGDIARSSMNYAKEAFASWQADAVTVAPYMGSDSVQPFISFPDKGAYLLNRTSNSGGKDLQNLQVMNSEKESLSLYMEVAHQIAAYNQKTGRVGAVVGATNLQELQDIASFYHDQEVPLLIPGVGSQGGSATEVMAVLRTVGYPVELARINSSSSLTHPWKDKPAPEDWLDFCTANLRSLLEETSL